MAIKALRKIQLGQEATKGTPVSASTVWRGLGMLADEREMIVPEEDSGVVGPLLDRAHFTRLMGSLDLESVPATFEQLPYLLASGVKKVVSGVKDGLGDGYIFTYDAPVTTLNDILTLTVEGGDDHAAERMAYAFCSKFKLTGSAGEDVMMEGRLEGRDVAANAFTGSVSIPSVEDIIFSKGKLYIDATGGTIGTTQKSNTFIEMDLDWTTGWIPVFTADGEMYFSFAKFAKDEIVLSLTFEHDASSVTEKEHWRDKSIRLIRVQFEGSAFPTGGTLYTNKTLRVDMAGVWETFDKIGEKDGNDIIKGTFRVGYSASDALKAQVVVVNAITTTLP